MLTNHRVLLHRALSFTRTLLMSATALVAPVVAHAQVVAGTGALAVGQPAPDFTVKSVDANGVTPRPFHLADHKGETVVIAFFPRARSQGCTVQMESYRDKYSTLLHGGRKVTLLSISTDSDTLLQSWIKESKFPFNFGSDEDRTVGMKYGASTGTGAHKRVLYVINPDGKIGYVASPFKQLAAEAYTELGAAIDKAAGMH